MEESRVSSRARRARTTALALVLLVLSLALRAPRGDLCELKGDEAVQYATARSIAREGARPIRGTHTTDGPRTAVHFFYLLAVPLVFEDGPESLRLGMTLLASGAIVVFFLAGRKDLGTRAALAGALLLATLPDLVHRGRWAWHPNLIAPFATLALLASLRAVRKPEGLAPAALLLVSGILPLVHYGLLGPALLGASLCLLPGTLLRTNRRALAGSLVLLVLLYFPHIQGEWENGFRDTLGALSVASKGRSDPNAAEPERAPLAYPKVALETFALETFARTLGLEGEERARARSLPAPLERGIDLALLALVAAGLGLGAAELVRALVKRERPRAPGVAAAFFLAGWAPFLVLRLPARQQYPLAVAPTLAALAGIVLAKANRRGAALLLLSVAVASILETRGALATIDEGATVPGSTFDLPIREKRAACELVLERRLELHGYPRLEYLVLLEDAHRELVLRSPGSAADFETPTIRVPYWDIDVSLPRPREPRGRVDLVVAPGPLPGEVARAGKIALVSR